MDLSWHSILSTMQLAVSAKGQPDEQNSLSLSHCCYMQCSKRCFSILLHQNFPHLLPSIKMLHRIQKKKILTRNRSFAALLPMALMKLYLNFIALLTSRLLLSIQLPLHPLFHGLLSLVLTFTLTEQC